MGVRVEVVECLCLFPEGANSVQCPADKAMRGQVYPVVGLLVRWDRLRLETAERLNLLDYSVEACLNCDHVAHRHRQSLLLHIDEGAT